MFQFPQRPRSGLSVIEAVVGVLLLAILAVLVLPAVERARGTAVNNQNRDRMRRIGFGVHAYHATHNSFPK